MSPALLADLVAFIHMLYVLAAVLPVPLIILGGLRRWAYVRRPALRLIHLAMVAFVAIESLLGAACPLTVLESRLRLQAGESGYAGSFVGHWIDRFLYYGNL